MFSLQRQSRDPFAFAGPLSARVGVLELIMLGIGGTEIPILY